MTVCKGSAVEICLETLHSLSVWGAVMRMLQAAECKGGEINIEKNLISCAQNL